jgi:putative ABC transport system permease protein
MRQDLRESLRAFKRRPGYTAMAVLSLALGLGANAAFFTLVDAALLAPLPIRDADRVANVYMSRSDGTSYGALSYADYRDLSASAPVFSGVAGYTGFLATVTDGGRAESVFGELVTGNFFQVLGVTPAVGRGFLPQEDRALDADPVAVLGYGFWQRRFGGDPAAVGQSITLNGRAYRIVGVAPRGFTGMLVRGFSADLWVPTMMMGQIRHSRPDDRHERFLFVKARLAPAATMDEAASAVDAIGRALERDHPETNRGRRLRLMRSTAVIVNPEADRVIRPAGVVLLAAAGLLLVVVCTNLAGLLLARAVSRRGEIAVRLALGAGRARIVRQMLMESTLLAGAGAAVALVLTNGLAALIVGFKPPLPVPLSFDVRVDGRVIAYTAGLAVLTAILMGLAPALRSSRTAVVPTLRGVPDPSRRRRWWGLRQSLLVPQVTVSFVLLLVAALFAHSLSRAGAVDPGFAVNRSAFVALNLGLSGYDEPRAEAFYDALTRRMASLPGLRAVAVTDRIPLDLYGSQSATLMPDDPARGPAVDGQMGHVGPGYFEALDIAIVRGRAFSRADMQPGAAVAIVSAETARRFWPGVDPIGRRLRLGADAGAPWLTVVGVAANVKVQSLGESPLPFVYRPLVGHTALLRIVAGTDDDPVRTATAMRETVAAIDPGVAVFDSGTLTDVLGVMLFPFRLVAGLGAALGIVAVALAGVGLYGVAAFTLAGRQRELAVRVALGATPKHIVRLVLGSSLGALGTGLAIGVPAAYGVARIGATWLFGIAPADPLAFGTATLVLAAAAGVAAIGPARRAMRSPPSASLGAS